jgi:hypothetical protein
MDQIDTSPISRRPIHIASEVKRGNAAVFIMRVGDTDASKTARYFEVQLPDGQHSVRAEWDSSVADKTRGRGGFAFRLIVDNAEPKEVVYRDGAIYEEGFSDSAFHRADSFLNEKDIREALLPFWLFGEAATERAQQIATQFMPTESLFDSDTVLSQWAGCESDFTGAEAGVGAVVGFVAGEVAGAVVGGVFGAVFGLGY